MRETSEMNPAFDDDDAAFEALLGETRREPHDLHLTGFAVRTADRAMAWRDRSPRGLWWSLPKAMRLGVAFSGAMAALALAVVSMPSRSAGSMPPGENAPLTLAQAESDESDDTIDPDDDATADDDCDESGDEEAANKAAENACTTTASLPASALLTQQELEAMADLYLPYPT